MHSICFEIGSITIHWYGVFMALGFMLGLMNWIWLGRKHGHDTQFCSDLMFWVMVSGIVGARIAYVFENWSEYAADPLTILFINQGGLIFYGGFVASGAAIIYFAKKKREPILPLFDFVITSVPLAHALGRIGCFLNGCCFGRCTTLPIGVQFPKPSAPFILHRSQQLIEKTATLSANIHPVQLYEASYNFMIYILLILIYRRTKRVGIVSAVYLMLYSVGRFTLELFRGDRGERMAVGQLSIGQFMSIPIFLLGVVLLVVLGRNQEAEGSHGLGSRN